MRTEKKLTNAGHCWAVGAKISRRASPDNEYLPIGTVKRRTLGEVNGGIESDGEAILLEDGVSVPRWVYWSHAVQYRISGSERSAPGSILCTSGSYSGSDCGVASDPFVAFPEDYPGIWVVESSATTTEGDSGGPVWNMTNGKAVGLVQGGYESTGPTWFTPLKPVLLPNGETHPGLLSELDAAGGAGFNVAD